MPQFPITPTRQKILERIPDYEVAMLPASGTVSVKLGDQEIARSSSALLVKETRHADVFYLPREDVDMSCLARTDHTTYCPFKGHASYWTASAGGGVEPNVVWSYEDPYPEVIELKDYLSFYPDRTEISFVAD
ncbi:MAG: DUF427 domain-containing protein [Pseudomonadales bacterium]|nr:DUF427 domain-containing protein [Pseudomonadales bacterium]